MTEKTCLKCSETKPFSMYYKGLNHCKKCVVKRVVAWRKRNKRTRTQSWRHYLKLKYGLTVEKYDIIRYEQQGNKCKICDTNLNDGKNDRHKACVDHDHKTGRVRGILCWKCNVFIGHAGDCTIILKKAIEYLTEE